MSRAKISAKWRKMQSLYRHFASDFVNLDFSEDAAREMYLWESQGLGNLAHDAFGRKNGRPNGYAVGKGWMNVQIASWREDINAGLLAPFELYEDPAYAEWHWWLDRVLHDPSGAPLRQAARARLVVRLRENERAEMCPS